MESGRLQTVYIYIYIYICMYIYIYTYIWKRSLYPALCFGTYCKRFAQSAGPGSKQLSLLLQYGVGFHSDMFFGVTFITLAPLLGSIVLPWRHFWSTLATLLVLKTRLRRQRCPRSAPRRPPPFRWHILGVILEVIFDDFPICSVKTGFKHTYVF